MELAISFFSQSGLVWFGFILGDNVLSSCLVLSCLAFSCDVLGCLVLSCFLMLCLGLSSGVCRVLSCLVMSPVPLPLPSVRCCLSCPEPRRLLYFSFVSCPVRCPLFSPGRCPFFTGPSYPISCAVPSRSTSCLSYPALCSQSPCTVLSCPVRSCPVLSCPVLSRPVTCDVLHFTNSMIGCSM